MRIEEVLDAAALEIGRLLDCKTIYDPQPVRSAEPHARLTFMGSSPNGVGSTIIYFQLSLVGAGDGPGTYLARLIELSMRVSDLYNNCNTSRVIDLENGSARLLLIDEAIQANGVFTQNDQKMVETNQWNYLFTEGRYIGIVVSDDTGRKE